MISLAGLGMKKLTVKKGLIMTDKYIYSVGLLCLLSAGCSIRQAGYSAAGAAAGGGIGYSINHDAKDAVIGGLGGALVGDLVGQWQDKSEKVKQEKNYKAGYDQAKLDIAVENWDQNTGKGTQPKKKLVSVTLPKREENGVVYDQRQITVEDYQ